jgi:hypothetical protein
MTRYQRPNMFCLQTLQAYSTRGWVYRLNQGWIFDTLTPDELAEFKTYDHRVPRIARVRFPHGPVVTLPYGSHPGLGNYFVFCTLTQVPNEALTRFQMQKVEEQFTHPSNRYTL